LILIGQIENKVTDLILIGQTENKKNRLDPDWSDPDWKTKQRSFYKCHDH